MWTDGRWRVSSHSGNQGDCVEVRPAVGGGVEVRHSKHPDAATIHYTDAEWAAFIAGVKDGEFDL